MQIQINTDDNVQGSEELTQRVVAEIEAALTRFSSSITRVEVHLSDENAGRSGGADKRCMMEARLSGSQPIIVTNEAATLEEAHGGAVTKLQRLLGSTLGRRSDHKGAESIRDNERR